MRARDGARRLVREALHPADLVGVATWAESRGMTQVLNFTSDRRQVEAAIDSLGLADPVDRPPDPLRLSIEMINDTGIAGGAAALSDDGRVRAADRQEMLLASLKDMQGMGTRTALEQKQGQILTMMGSLAQLASWLRSVPGQIHLVLLSEGFDSTVLLGLSHEDQERREELAREVQNGQYWRVNNDERYGNQMALFGVTQALEELVRAGARIQAVDIGGLRSGDDSSEAAIRQEGLFLLANETGGELYRNYNDLGQAMGEMLERTSVTYVLAFQPTDLALDGTYRQLRVSLKGGPKGAEVVYRPGYYAPVSYAHADPDQRRIRNATLLFGNQDGGLIDARTLAFPLPPGSGEASVAVLLEVAGASLIRDTSGNLLPVEIYVYALDADGEIRDFFAQALGFDLRRDAPLLHRSGFKFWGDLALPAGSYALRILVRNSSAGNYYAASVPIEVPGAHDGPLLLPPFFSDPPGRFMVAQERTSGTAPASYPFVRRGATFMPAVRPTLLLDYENELTLLVYSPPAEAVTLGAWLKPATAVEGPVIPVTLVVEEREALGTAAQRLHGYVSPAGMPPGDYVLGVGIQGREIASSIAVRIESPESQ